MHNPSKELKQRSRDANNAIKENSSELARETEGVKWQRRAGRFIAPRVPDLWKKKNTAGEFGEFGGEADGPFNLVASS